MAAGPGVALQCDSPARELSLSVHQGSNQIHGDRIKTEESAGNILTRVSIMHALSNLLCVEANEC